MIQPEMRSKIYLLGTLVNVYFKVCDTTRRNDKLKVVVWELLHCGILGLYSDMPWHLLLAGGGGGGFTN